jgi:hypothetical protein
MAIDILFMGLNAGANPIDFNLTLGQDFNLYSNFSKIVSIN